MFMHSFIAPTKIVTTEVYEETLSHKWLHRHLCRNRNTLNHNVHERTYFSSLDDAFLQHTESICSFH